MIKKIFFIFVLGLLPMFSFAQSNPGIADIINLKAIPENPVVGEISRYTVSFDITTQAHLDLKNGTLLITFPEGFDISAVGVEAFIDNSEELTYDILRSSSSGSSINLQVKDSKSAKPKTTIISDTPEGYVSISLTINNIINTSVAGSYQISMIALKKNNTVLYGPGLSAPFQVIPAGLARIEVTPSGPINLTAGDILNFHARGYDRYENFINGIVYEWSLIGCETSCIGNLTDSTFLATTIGTGSVSASAQGLMRSSGIITVIAGKLSEITLNVSSDQFVGIPLVGDAYITLSDNYGNLISDYSLSDNPISLNLTEGQLEPSILDNNVYLNNGMIDLNAAGVTYNGNSFSSEITASNSAVVSAAQPIAFNRYDIFNLLNSNNEPISSIYADIRNYVTVSFGNFGNQIASSNLDFKTYFKSAATVGHNPFTAPVTGELHSVTIPLLFHELTPAVDTLVVELISKFNSPDGEVLLVSKREYEVEILPPPTLYLVENSLTPDTVLADISFDLTFAVTSPASIPVPDSIVVNLMLNDLNDTPLGEIFSGSAVYNFIDNQTLKVSGINSLVSSDLIDNSFGDYKFNLSVNLFSGGSIYALNELIPIYVYPANGLEYISGTLSPQTLYAGSDVTFDFNLDNSFTGLVTVLAEGSQFTLMDGDYVASANLVTTGQLEAGTNNFVSNRMFIPLELIGKKLTAKAKFKYLLEGLADTLLFETDFTPDTIQIDVASQPMVRIIALDIIAPNQPRVNVSQQFELNCKIANLSEQVINNLEVGLYSTGPFNLDSSKTVTINPGETAEVIFNVTAWQTTTISDFIRVEILSQGLTILPALDDIAIIAVETPADLILDYRLLGASGNVVDVNNNFDIDIRLDNQGQAEVSASAYRLIIDGLDANGPDTITGTLAANDHFDFSATAPAYDTTITVVFNLLESPIDLNSALPAVINQTGFAFDINVVSISTEVQVETELLGSNLLLPGRQQDILKFTIRNNSSSSLALIRLEKFEFEVSDSQGLLNNVRDIINLANTGIYSDGIKVTSPVAGDDRLSLLFDDFLVWPQQEVVLILKIEFKEFASSTIVLKMSEEDLQARYAAGPNEGELVPVSSSNPGTPLLNSAFVLKGMALDHSFLIEKNPVDPKNEPVHFSYELPQDSNVEFKIFTLTGELVYEKYFSAGNEGGITGENDLYWDGRNESGYIVNNGVYIAYIKNMTTDETAKIKVAILK